MSESPLQTPVQYLAGVGPKRALLLQRLDLQTVEDVLLNLPRDYLDLTVVKAASELEAGKLQTVRGRVVDLDGRLLSGNRALSAVLLDCDGQYVRGVWFNQSWVLSKFQPDDHVLFSGKPKRAGGGRWEMSHPRVQWLEAEESRTDGGILPCYRLTEGLKMYQMRRIARNAVEQFAEFAVDLLPTQLREQANLPGYAAALRGVHFPSDQESLTAARRRIIYQDLLEFQLGLALRRRLRRRLPAAPNMPTTVKIDARIRRLFPFTFTPGQLAAIRDISADLDSGTAMHRLLQADVGAGKTAVAIYAMLVAIAAGHQAVLMAPTELLSAQHWSTIDSILSHSRVKRLCLTGTLTSRRRQKALADIQRGSVQLIVGTQAIIQKDVRFCDLGLVVIDEQHKFGVMQRAHFSNLETLPHMLVMTATPIPRSLCLTQFGDLDLTVMSDVPPGRRKVTTSVLFTQAAQQRVWDFVCKKLRSGRQAYIVCPRIHLNHDEETANGDASAETVHQHLVATQLREFRVGLIHGQMDRGLKSTTMQAFRSGDIQVLVSTTVVEVGVDVPNATLMVIYQSERFGLSQLHQLRGRISRGTFDGYCFLFSRTQDPQAVGRLHAMEKMSDGFQIAETDFQLRGPGDVLGTRQHGDLPLKVADLTHDEAILCESRQAAFELVNSGRFDQAEFTPLKIRVLERFEKQMDLIGSG